MRRCHTFFGTVRHIRFPVLILLVALLFPVKSISQTVTFNFRAINLAPGLSGLDVHFNNLEQASLSGIEFGYASQVLTSLPAVNGTFNVKVTATGQGVGNAFAGTDVSAVGNREYVGVAYGSAASRKLKVLERNRAQLPAAEKTLVRVVNAIEEGIEIDVHLGQLGGTPLFAAVAADQATPFINVPAEATGLIVTEKGKSTPIAQVTAPFGGTPYVTLIVTGLDRSSVQVYALSDFEQQLTQLIRLEEASYSNARVVHLRPDAGLARGDSLDIYFNKVTQGDAKVTDSLRYRNASREYGPVFSDSFRIKFVPAGESPGTDILTHEQRLGNDTSYVVVLTQFQDLNPTALVLTRTPVQPLPGLSSKIRFANATDFYGPITLVLEYGGDSIRFEEVAFKSATDFRDIDAGALVSVKAYRSGNSEPFFRGTPQVVPPGSFLTIFASGNEMGFAVDALNESQSGRQILMAFDPASGSVPSADDANAVPVAGIPNPASTHARVRFSLEHSGRIEIDLFDVMGRAVASVPATHFNAGEGEVGIELGRLAPGLYTCVLRSEEGAVGTTKIVVAR